MNKRVRTRSRRRVLSKLPGLSVIIPVFNEARTIASVVERVCAVRMAGVRSALQIIVVDDGSTDGTPEALHEAARSGKIALAVHAANRGKGAAIRTGLDLVQGDIVIVQDADLEYDPMEYGKLLTPILQDRADVVYGSRFAPNEPHRVLYFWHSQGNKLLTFLSNMFTDLNLTDMETGFKVFRTGVLRRVTIEEDRFGFEPEITAKIARLSRREGIRIYEVGISYHGRTYHEGKKIGWKDGVKALYCIIRYNAFT